MNRKMGSPSNLYEKIVAVKLEVIVRKLKKMPDRKLLIHDGYGKLMNKNSSRADTKSTRKISACTKGVSGTRQLSIERLR